MRRTTYALIWLAVTAAAVFVAAVAVGSVRDQVTETPTAMLPTTTTATSLPDSAVPTTEPEAVPPPTTPETIATSTTTTVIVSTTTAPDASTTTTQPLAPTTTTTITPPTTTTAPPAPELRSYELIGGSVTVEIGSKMVHLAGASPKAGFSMDVENPGPEKVEVEFTSETHESHFSGRFEDGAFVPKIEEERHEEDD